MEMEFTQCRVFFGVRPSPRKTCPRCPPQLVQVISVRRPSASVVRLTASPMASSKLGQPVPLSNFSVDSNSGVSQPAHENVPERSSCSSAQEPGRSVPWWLAGLSMVATTFSSDTPNWVTEQVRKYGVAGNWQWWAFVLTGVATVFFFARLWRRSGVMTDLEFYEHRYSGTAASVVRGFRALYLGLFFNCFIMGMVTLAACEIANILFGMPAWQTIVVCGILNVVFAAHSGLISNTEGNDIIYKIGYGMMIAGLVCSYVSAVLYLRIFMRIYSAEK